MDFDIIVVGSYSIDLIFSGMTEFPKLGKDVHSTDFHVTPGESFITAVCMHRLGIKIGWAGDFGNDDYSQLALSYAAQEGLDDSLFVIHQRPYRRVSVAATYPQDRAFLTYYDPDPKIPAAIPALINSRAKAIYFPGLYYGSFLTAGLKLIRQKNMKLIMDGNSSNGDIYGKDRTTKAIQKAIAACDIFLPNAAEARRLTGKDDVEDALIMLSNLCPLVVIKNGSSGSISYKDHNIVCGKAISVTPIDTTGAGDNYNAGFLRAWLDGQDLDTCMLWGNICGGLSATEIGGTTYKITTEIVNNTISKIRK